MSGPHRRSHSDQQDHGKLNLLATTATIHAQASCSALIFYKPDYLNRWTAGFLKEVFPYGSTTATLAWGVLEFKEVRAEMTSLSQIAAITQTE